MPPPGEITGRPGRRVRGALLAALLGAALMPAGGAPAADAVFAWDLPRGFPQPVVPDDNPMSMAKVSLGERLFADTRLSINGRYACRSCHLPQRAFTDGLPVARGAAGDALALNTPSLLNAAYNASLGWEDAGARTLEQQMRGPLFNEHPRELGLAGREAMVENALGQDAQLVSAFAAAFPGEARALRMENVIRAIAAYERTLFAGHSAFDRYVFAGRHDALDAAQKRGMELFFSRRAGCSGCHGGINFAGAWVDRGQQQAPSNFADTGTGRSVRVPSLRNLAATAPYLHDGRMASLDAVLAHYEELASDARADPRLRRPPLTTAERADLLGFLDSLNDSR